MSDPEKNSAARQAGDGPGGRGEPGPHVWRVLRAARAGGAPISGKEALLYTDATTPADRLDLGAVSLRPAVDATAPGTAPAARLVLRWWEYEDSEAALRPDYETVSQAKNYWLGLRVDQEVAALVSLLLGIRCRSGGTVRRYNPADPVGHRTDQFEHDPPMPLPALRGWPMVQLTSVQAIPLDTIAPQLHTLSTLRAVHAVDLMRAAVTFSDALWIADHDPELAWLHCITALELAAERLNSDHGDPVQLLTQVQPKLAQLLTEFGEDALDRGAKIMRGHIGVWRKLTGLLQAFPPAAPVHRPDLEFVRLDWDDHDDILNRFKTIYRHRSARLHGGVLFPAPLLRPPITARAEHPGGVDDTGPLRFRSGPIDWKNIDLPMTLHSFAHLTRSCLLAWWDSLADLAPC